MNVEIVSNFTASNVKYIGSWKHRKTTAVVLTRKVCSIEMNEYTLSNKITIFFTFDMMIVFQPDMMTQHEDIHYTQMYTTN